jgi:RNase P subunit RPR2
MGPNRRAQDRERTARFALPPVKEPAVAVDPKPPIVLCPGCRTPMQPGEPQPVLSTTDLTETVYICETCGTSTTRMVKKEKRA